MVEDSALLQSYAKDRSEASFAELVRRHLDFVHQCALRRVGGDRHLAQDVSQQVFIALARQADSLAHRDSLLGWFHTTVRNTAAVLRRTEQRRRFREHQAHAMNDLTSDSARDTDWLQLRPILDDTLDQLDERDRTALFLRFFEGKSFAAIGAQLRLTENAARMRVERALKRMETSLARKGITSTATGLGIALASSPAHAAPAGLAAAVTHAALAANATASGATALLAFMSTSKITAALAAALLLACAGWYSQSRATAGLRQQVAALHRAIEHAPRSSPGAAATLRHGAAESNPPPATRVPPHTPSSNPAAPAGLRQVADWQNRGTATPADALESYLWAVEQVDADTTAKTIAFGTRRAQVDAYFSGLSDAVRSEYHTPEELWAAVMTGSPHDHHITAYQILFQTTDPALGDNYLELRVRTVKDGGLTEEGDIRFEQTPTGWKRSIDDRAGTLIDPIFHLFDSTAAPSARHSQSAARRGKRKPPQLLTAAAHTNP